MAASAVVSQAGGLIISTSFRKDTSDKLHSTSQSCFVGSPRSMGRLRGSAGPREAASPRPVSAMFPGNNFMADVQKDDVEKDIHDEEDEEDVLSSSSEFLETVNNVIADVVDGQKYLKETGRTKPRPMKRRSLIVCLAMGAIQPYLSEVEDRMTSLRRTTSNSLAKTVRLVSQISIGASQQLTRQLSRKISFGRQLSFGQADSQQFIPATA